MKDIFAPWRISYIQSTNKPSGCIFCSFPEQDRDEENLILHRGQHSFVILNRYPYNSGHLMVVPYRHTSDYCSLKTEEVNEIHNLSSIAIDVMKRTIKPEGFNLGVNLGKVAGAGVEDHVHLHIVPRWNGDTNFMPVMGDVRVIPQSLEDTYRVFAESWPR